MGAGTNLTHYTYNLDKQLTINTLTNALVYQFTYDANNLLTSVTDGDGNVTAIERTSGGAPLAVVSSDGLRTTLGLDANGYLSRVTNPQIESTQFTYTSLGLLTTMADPKGNTSHVTYDTLGRLVHDQNAAGGFWEVANVPTARGRQVSMTSALGMARGYLWEKPSAGGTHRLDTDPSGLSTLTDVGSDGVTKTTVPDGTITTVAEGPDPRFEMESPLQASVKVQTPAGHLSTVTSARSAALANPVDPLSLETLIDTVSVNGRAYTSTFNAATRTMTRRTPAGRQTTSVVDEQLRVLQA